MAVADLERPVELGHALADDLIDPDEEHYGTDRSFVPVAPGRADDVPDREEGGPLSRVRRALGR